MPKPLTITREILLHQAQMEFLDNTALYKSLVAGIGSGKSWIGSYDLIRRAKPGRLYMVIAPTYTILSDSTFRSFLKVADEDLGLIDAGDASIKRSAPPSIRLPTGAEILFRSGDDPDRLRGPNLSGVWLDEASLMGHDVFKVAIGRLRQSGEQGWLTATFTPKGRKHWTYETFALGAPNTAMVRAKTRDNPFNPPGFADAIRSQYTAREAEQELEGLFLEEGGLNFQPRTWPRYADLGDAVAFGAPPSREVVNKAGLTVLVAIDVATLEKDTSDYTSFVAGGLLPPTYPQSGLLDNRLVILDVVNERMRLESIGKRLDAFCERWQPAMVAGDDDNLSRAMLLEYRRWPNIPEVRCLPIAGRAKIVRAQPAIIMGENGRVWLPGWRTPWYDDYCDQLSAFTGLKGKQVEHDDMVDATGILARQVNLLRQPSARRSMLPMLLVEGWTR